MRTWLFAPGHERRKVDKALASAADMVVLDWEDAVPEEQKGAARETTLAALATLDVPALQRVVVRVGSPSGAHFVADRHALEGLPLGALMVPKVEAESEILEVAALECPLIVLLESALGVELAFQLAAAHPAVRHLAFGPLDLLADVGGSWTLGGEETLYARHRVVIAARAARKAGALDGPWPVLDDLVGLRDDTRRGRAMGYAGRLLIHPTQIEVVAEVYRPSRQELAMARRVLEEVAAGRAAGRGALRVDGRFVDPPVVRWAERVVREAMPGSGGAPGEER
jgi:citrate lyase subunit beta/citryl-CoA lyase